MKLIVSGFKCGKINVLKFDDCNKTITFGDFAKWLGVNEQ